MNRGGVLVPPTLEVGDVAIPDVWLRLLPGAGNPLLPGAGNPLFADDTLFVGIVVLGVLAGWVFRASPEDAG